MLFKLENCRPAEYQTDTRQRALTNILRTHGERKNIVITDKATSQAIIDNQDLYGSIDRQYASDILESIVEYRQLLDLLSVYVIIDFDYQEISCHSERGQTTIRVGYNYFNDSDNTNAMSLITENEHDFKFFQLVTRYYINTATDTKLSFKFQFVLGAGSHSKNMFDKLTKENKFALCVVDNDKAHPNKSEGGTASKFKELQREYNGLTLAKVLDVREIESLIPSTLIQKITNKLKMPKPKDNAYVEMDSYQKFNPQFRVYFDHKEGLSLKKAIELDSKHGEFWLNIMASNKKFANIPCLLDKRCGNHDYCHEIFGFGNKLLMHTVQELEKYNLRSLERELDDYLVGHWESIGQLMMSWGCSGSGKAPRS